jgi:hypothetical protein
MMLASSRLLVLLVSLLVASTVAVEISGKIESTSSLYQHSLRELNLFLKGGEAETYQNVEIKYIHGRKAVLTIFHDGEEQEKIKLYKLRKREDMHAMFLEKGFVLKAEEERERDAAGRKGREGPRKVRNYSKTGEIRQMETGRDGTSDRDKKQKMAAAIEVKSQPKEKQDEETRKRSEEIKYTLQHDHAEL